MNIYQNLANIQNELKAPKSQFNSFGHYNYRNCEDILEAVKPLCLKHKTVCFLSDNIVNISDRFYVKATATLVDIETSEKIEVNAFAREELSKKGMDGSQVTGASSSYARKYALNGLFDIDDTKDSDTTNGQPQAPKDNFKKAPTQSMSNITELYAIAITKGYDKKSVDSGIRKRYNKTVETLSNEEYDKMVNGYKSLKDA